MNLSEFQRFKNLIAAKRSEVDKSKGALEQLFAELKRDFSIDHKQIKGLLDKLRKEEGTLTTKQTETMEQWQTKYADKMTS